MGKNETKKDGTISYFISQKFKDDTPDRIYKFKVIGVFLDTLGTIGLSLSSDQLFDEFRESTYYGFHRLTLDDFNMFMGNSFISKFLDDKVITRQKPKIREMLMRMTDGNDLSLQEIKAIELLKSLVDKNESTSSNQTYVYVTTPHRGSSPKEIDALMEKHVTEVNK